MMIKPFLTRRRMCIASAVLLGVLLVGLFLLPFVASSGPATRLALGVVNGSLPGEAKVDNFGIGWTGGLVVEGFELTDSDGVVVASTAKLEVPGFGLLDAWWNALAAGEVRVVDARLDVVRYADGSTSLSRALPPAGPEDPNAEPFDLASLVADLTVENAVITSRSEGGPAVAVVVNGQVACDGPSGASVDLEMAWTNDAVAAGATRVVGEVAWDPEETGVGWLAALPMRVDRIEGRIMVEDWALTAVDRLASGGSLASELLGQTLDGQASIAWTRGQPGRLDVTSGTGPLTITGGSGIGPNGLPASGEVAATLEVSPQRWPALADAVGIADWPLRQTAQLSLRARPSADRSALLIETDTGPLVLASPDGDERRFRVRAALEADQAALSTGVPEVMIRGAIEQADDDATPREVATLTGTLNANAGCEAARLQLSFDGVLAPELPIALTTEAQGWIETLGALSGSVDLSGPMPTGANGEFTLRTDLRTTGGLTVGGEADAGWRSEPDEPESPLITLHSERGITLEAKPELVESLAAKSAPGAGLGLTDAVVVTLRPDRLTLRRDGAPQAGEAHLTLGDLAVETAVGFRADLRDWSGRLAAGASPGEGPTATFGGKLGHDGSEGQLTLDARLSGGAEPPRLLGLDAIVDALPSAWLDPLTAAPGLAAALLGPSLQATATLDASDPDRNVELALDTEHGKARASLALREDGQVQLRSAAEAALSIQPAGFAALLEAYAPGVSMALEPGQVIQAKFRVPLAQARIRPASDHPKPNGDDDPGTKIPRVVLPVEASSTGLDLEASIEPVTVRLGRLGAFADIQQGQATLSIPRLDRTGSLGVQLRMAGRSDATEGPAAAVNDTGLLLALDTSVDRLFDGQSELQPLMAESRGDLRFEADAALLAQLLQQGPWLRRAMGQDGRFEAKWDISQQTGGDVELKLATASKVDFLAKAQQEPDARDLAWSIDFAVPKQWGVAMMRLGMEAAPAEPTPGASPATPPDADESSAFASEVQYQALRLLGRFDPQDLKLHDVEGDVQAHLDFRRSSHFPPAIGALIRRHEIAMRPTIRFELTEFDLLQPYFSSGDVAFNVASASFKVRDTIAPVGRSTLEIRYDHGDVRLTQLNANLLRGNVFATGAARLDEPDPIAERPMGTVPGQLDLRMRDVELRPVASMLFEKGSLPARVGGVLSADVKASGHAMQLLGTLNGRGSVRVRRGNLAPVPILSDVVQFLVARLPSGMQSSVESAMQQVGLIWRPGAVAAPAFGKDTADIDMLLKTNRVEFTSIDMLTRMIGTTGYGSLFLTGHTDFWLKLDDGNGNPAIRLPMSVALRAVGRQVRVTGPVMEPEVGTR